MKVFIGITTYNRKELIERTVKTLLNADGISDCEICICDDCSAEYGVDFLEKLIPGAAVYRSDKNYGADYNTYVLFKKFLESDADVLIVADSDLIYRKDAITFVIQHVGSYPFFSLFNTPYHETVGEYNDCFVEKKNLGAAGCCIRRELAELVIQRIQNPEKIFDWKLSIIIKEHGEKILCVKNSMVQHVGFSGLHSNAKMFDYGNGFKVDSLECAQIIEDLLEQNENDIFNMNNTLSKSRLWKIMMAFRRLFIKKK